MTVRSWDARSWVGTDPFRRSAGPGCLVPGWAIEGRVRRIEQVHNRGDTSGGGRFTGGSIAPRCTGTIWTTAFMECTAVGRCAQPEDVPWRAGTERQVRSVPARRREDPPGRTDRGPHANELRDRLRNGRTDASRLPFPTPPVRLSRRAGRAAVAISRSPHKVQEPRPRKGTTGHVRPSTSRTPGPGEVLVKVQTCGCATRTCTTAKVASTMTSRSCRHEAAGLVESVGDGVAEMEPGDPSWCSPRGLRRLPGLPTR